MPQFTDPPYFLLEDFFNNTLVLGTPPELVVDEDSLYWQDFWWMDSDDWKWKDFNFWSWVRWLIYTTGGWSDGGTLKGQYNSGLCHGIVVDGGGATELWVLTPDAEGNDTFIPIKLTFSAIDGNFFQFFQNYEIDTNSWDAGSPVFFRKNSKFHDWLRLQRTSPNTTVNKTVERYVSTEKPFMYFGKIYPISDATTSGQNFHVEFWGMKDWTVEALPSHNRTDRIKEIFNLYFDRLYHESYQSLKEVNTLLDPIEVDINYLGLITELFNVTLIEDIADDLRKRQFTKSIINFLKRKGTYSSLYAIFRVMLGDTSNRLNVYERWHKGKNPEGDRIGNQSVTSPVYPHFFDKLYISYYGEDVPAPSASLSCANGVGDEYYGTLGASAYPTQYGDNDPTIVTPTSAADYLSPHYKVEIDLSCEPLGDEFIIDQATVESLLDYWEIVRPVARVAHYRYLVSPITDFTGTTYPLYSAYYSAIMNSIITTPVRAATPPAALYVQIFNSDEWTFNHNLGSNDLIVQTFNLDYEMVYPSDIIIDDSNTVRVTWDKPVGGYLLVYADSAVTQGAAATTWNVSHSQGGDVFAQFDHVDAAERKKLMPLSVEILTDDTLQAKFSTARSGWTITSLADYTHTQGVANTTWQVEHNLEVSGIQVQCLDSSREIIIPTSITAIDQDTVIIEFESAITGWVFIKAIGDPATQQSVIDKLTGGYIKFGIGTDLDTWNPVFNNDVKEELYRINWPKFSVTKRNNMYHVDADTAGIFEGEITEIGIFNNEDNLIFYTQCSPFYKPEDVGITLHYRIMR